MPQDAYVPKTIEDLKAANPEVNDNNQVPAVQTHTNKENGSFLSFNNNSTSLHLLSGILSFHF